jgi:hypothetical protein
MSVICLHCKPKRPGKHKIPESKVIDSRLVSSRAKLDGKTVRTRTMRRRRECLKCGYRWNTLEYSLPAKRGKSHGQFGRRAKREQGTGRLLPESTYVAPHKT